MSFSTNELFSYFDNRKQQEKPVMLTTIGIPGSGKSYFLSKAPKDYIWISSDKIREDFLRGKSQKQEKVLLRGVEKIPDPMDAADVFAPELRSWVHEKCLSELDEAIQKGSNVVLDITAVNLQRVYFTMMARKAGYIVDAILFEPGPLSFHLANIQKRVDKGGLDLAPKSETNKEQGRAKIIESVRGNLQCFISSIKESSKYLEIQNEIPNFLPAQSLKNDSANFQSFYEHLELHEKKIVDILVSEDIYNQIIRVPLS